MLRGVQVKLHITNTQQETCTARETGKQLKMFIVNMDAEQATFGALLPDVSFWPSGNNKQAGVSSVPP